jgi:hypothetical protein
MNETDDRELREYLKKEVPPTNAELQRDLWPAMLRRMEARERHVPWFDWVLLGAMAACVAFVPQMIPMLLYHL